MIGCFTSPFAHLDEVPVQHVESWAVVWVDILEYFHRAPDVACQCRALKWMFVIHDLLLRLPPRGGRRGHDQVAQRLAAWSSGDLAKLVSWWERDRLAAHHPISYQRADDEGKQVERTLKLIVEGEMGKAAHLLHSNGLGDLSDERIVDQLRQKHPPRKAVVPAALEQLGDFRRIQVDLGTTLRGLNVHAGTGVSGFRNSFLKVLAQSFSDPRAAQALPLLEQFAEAYINAELPGWFYYVFSSLKVMPPLRNRHLTQALPQM